MTKEKHPTERVGRNPRIQDTSSDKPVKQAPTVTETKQSESKTDSTSAQKNYLVRIKRAPAHALAKFNGLSRNWKLASILAVVLVVVGVLALTLSTGSNNPKELAQEEVVEEIASTEKIGAAVTLRQGTLETKDESGEWVTAADNYQPEEGDAIRTVGATSRSVITFDDGSALRLDANSEVEMLSMNIERVVVRHISGYTYSRVVPADSRTYIVETNEAQYQALGTAFKTIASGDEQAVEVYQSTVHETLLNKKPTEGEKLIVSSKTEPNKDGTIEKLDIEQVKQDQFMVWNKELDEQDETFKNNLGFLKDFDAPELTITSHSDGETVLLDSSATEGTIVFKGTTEKGTTLTVQSKSQNGSSPIQVSVDDAGTFSSPVLSAPLGNSVFEFIAKDRVGNTSIINLRINFQRKSAPITTTQDGVSLTASEKNGKVTLSWKLLGDQKAEDGYKVVWNETGNPTFPGDNPNPQFTSEKTATVEGLGTGTYYFRVCVYNGTNCDVYSNQEKITID